MKKVMSFLLTTVLCLGMATTVFAAPSPEIKTDSPITDNSGKVDSPNKDNSTTTLLAGTTVINGQTVQLNVSYINDAVKATFTKAQADAYDAVYGVIASGDTNKIFAMQKDLIKNVAGKTVTSVKNPRLVDVSLPAGTTIPTEGIAITLTDSNVKAGMNIVMLHLKEDGTWENIAVKVEDGKITGTFYSLSPVYYFEVEEAVESGYTPYYPADETVAPKTGETSIALYVSLLSVVFAAGVVVCTKKVKVNR